MLIGKTENCFYAFDYHSGNSDGMCSISGKSTRVILQNVHEVFCHLERLVLHWGSQELLNVTLLVFLAETVA